MKIDVGAVDGDANVWKKSRAIWRNEKKYVSINVFSIMDVLKNERK